MNDFVSIRPLAADYDISIDWFIGKRCNYDCSYCTEDLHDNISKHQNFVQIKKLIDNLSKKLENKAIHLSITGGEPTVHPNFIDICHYIKKKKNIKYLTVTTNGSRLADYYIELLYLANQITFSQHFETAQNSVYLEKVKEINEFSPGVVNVQVMFNAKHFEEAKEAVEFYRANEIRYTLRKIRHKMLPIREYDTSSYDYTDRQLDWFDKQQNKKRPNTVVHHRWHEKITLPAGEAAYKERIDPKHVHVNEISSNNLQYFKDWTCYAGLKGLHLRPDGTVYRGNCRMGGEIGNILDNDFELPSEPIVCDGRRCFCAHEINLLKYKGTDRYVKNYI